jgi:very-short-patch-repair endonuclease
VDYLQYINIERTEQEFGPVKNNQSIIYIICSVCKAERKSRLISLKNRLRDNKGSICNSCSVKEKWKDSEYKKRQTKIKSSSLSKRNIELWKDPEYRKKHTEKHTELWKDLEYRKKQIEKKYELWKDQKYRNNQIEKKHELWNNPEYQEKQKNFKTDLFKANQSKKQRLVGQNSEYKANQSEKHKLIWNNLEYKANQSEKHKLVWQRPGHREHQSKKQKLVWQNPSYRKRFEDLWQSPEFKNKISQIVKSKYTPIIKDQLSKISSLRWQNPEYRSKIIERLKASWTNERRQLSSLRSKALWSDPNFIAKMQGARRQQLFKRSSIEIITENILKFLNIEFTSEYPLGKYLFDFYLPNHELFIECQGEYWHSIKDRPARDAAKFSYLEKAKPESRILYLHEREFLNPDLINHKIINFLTANQLVVQTVNFDFKEIEIKILDVESKNLAKQFLQSFHYAQFGRSAKLMFGAYLQDELIAVCKFSTPIRQEVATSLNYKYSEVLELDRFCIHPAYHKKNFASWFISRCSKLIDSKKIRCLVSFADYTYGHLGTIYKAANWQEIGKIRPDYYYVNEEGFILHKKTLYNQAVKMGKIESEYAREFNYTKLFGKEKIKFICKL